MSAERVLTFELVPQTNRQNFNMTIQFSEHVDSGHDNTAIVALTPTPDPPGQIGGTGHYSSPAWVHR